MGFWILIEFASVFYGVCVWMKVHGGVTLGSSCGLQVLIVSKVSLKWIPSGLGDLSFVSYRYIDGGW